MKMAKDMRRGGMWINAKVIGTCDNVYYETEYYDYEENMNVTTGRKDHNVCHERDALKGQGLEIKWPSSVYGYTKFSRLISGIDTRETERSHCVYVEQERKHLWMLADCETERYWGLCVKRKCLWPEHIGKL